jgi:hypothetical protein
MQLSDITPQHKDNISYSVTDFLADHKKEIDDATMFGPERLYYSEKTGMFIVSVKHDSKNRRFYLEGKPDFGTTYPPYLQQMTDDCRLTSDYELIHEY